MSDPIKPFSPSTMGAGVSPSPVDPKDPAAETPSTNPTSSSSSSKNIVSQPANDSYRNVSAQSTPISGVSSGTPVTQKALQQSTLHRTSSLKSGGAQQLQKANARASQHFDAAAQEWLNLHMTSDDIAAPYGETPLSELRMLWHARSEGNGKADP